MKTIFLFLLISLAIAVDPEQCAKDKCPNEYNACKKAVFGCASKALGCKNKCGSTDPACFEKCVYDSKDSKLIAVYECGKINCPASQYWFLDNFCDIQGCLAQFQEQCTSNLVECALTFYQRNPQCLCLE